MARVVAILCAVALGACANTSTNRKCEGSVFFAEVGCHEVTPAKQAPAPVAKQSPAPAPPQPAPAAPATPVAPAVAAAPPPEPVPPSLNVIYFPIGSANLMPDAKLTLGQLADYLKAASAEKVSLYGFVDPTGSKARNRQLLVERTKAVHKFFTDAGIEPARVEIPKSSVVAPPAGFPPSDYWALRKVLVNYSSNALAAVEKHEREDEVVAENDVKPPPRDEKTEKSQKPKQAKAKTNGAKPEAAENVDADGLEKIDVLYWRSTNHSLLLLAKALGYFRDEGFAVALHESQLEANQMSVEVAEGVAAVKTPLSAMDLKKKKYFMGAICPIGYHDGLAKGLPLVQIGGLLENPNTMIMRKELVAAVRKDLAAFRDKTIGMVKNGPSDIDYTELFTNQLNVNHVPYKVKWYTSFAESTEAVARGEVDAALSIAPYDQEFIERHPETAMFELRGLYSRLPCCRQLVTRAQLRDKKQRAKYVRFERAVIRAHKYYTEHKLETSEIVAKMLKMNPATVRAIFLRPGYSLDPNPNLKGTVAFYNTLKDHIGKQDVREAVDTSVYEEALLGLAGQNTDDPYYKVAVREFRQTN